MPDVKPSQMTASKRSFKTTFLGLFALATIGFNIYMHPEMITNPETIAQIAGGIGLIMAGDATQHKDEPKAAE